MTTLEMIQALKRWLYNTVTGYGLILYLLTAFKPIVVRLLNMSSGQISLFRDAGGNTMKVTRFKRKIFPSFGTNRIAAIKGVKVRPDDVLLCGYPKTGCHWVHEILHMLVTGNAEMTEHGKVLGGMIDAMPAILLDSLPSPRVLNSHVLYEELPMQVRERKTKIVWTVRSPKDTVVSFYNHTQALTRDYEYKGSFDNFFELFMSGPIEYGTYFDYVLAWETAMTSQLDNPILVVEYEKLKCSPVQKVKEIAQFLNIDITHNFAKEVAEASDFKKMKENRIGNKLIRKGQIGDWRNWLTAAQSARIDSVWRQRMSQCTYQPDNM